MKDLGSFIELLRKRMFEVGGAVLAVSIVLVFDSEEKTHIDLAVGYLVGFVNILIALKVGGRAIEMSKTNPDNVQRYAVSRYFAKFVGLTVTMVALIKFTSFEPKWLLIGFTISILTATAVYVFFGWSPTKDDGLTGPVAGLPYNGHYQDPDDDDDDWGGSIKNADGNDKSNNDSNAPNS